MLIFDGHLDIAMNAVHWNRDLTQPLDKIRGREAGMTDKLDRGNGTVSLPEMRKAEIGVCVATQIGHSVSQESPLEGWHSPEIAWAQTQAQLAWYEAMQQKGEMKKICSARELKDHIDLWSSNVESNRNEKSALPVGFILSLEGADSLLTIDHLHIAHQYGLRLLGPAHYGPGRYAAGTGAEEGFEEIGFRLLDEMSALRMILDLTHLTDKGFWQAIDRFDGPVWASHNNCRAIVDAQRQFPDSHIKAIIERGGIVGVAFDAWMLSPGWIRGETTPKSANVSMENVADHIDHICQLAGNANHVCIGSDLDGAYGNEQTPKDLKTICDLQKLPAILANRGYKEPEIAAIMNGNAIRFFTHHLM